MKISQKGIDLIKGFENFSAVVYPCPSGFPTIGWGHRIKNGERFTSITEAEAEEILRADLDFFENIIEKNVKVPLSQNQFDALVSFAMNNRVKSFLESTLLRYLNKKDYKGAAQQFNRWIYANGKPLNGLIKRRAKEREVFES
jgi:lysozyme